MMSLHLDKLPKGQQEWIEANGLHRFSTRKEERGRNRGNLRHLNAQGGRPVANIVARNSGIRPKDAPPGEAGWILRQPYLCKGARRMATLAVIQERGLYNGALGEVADIVFRKRAIARRLRPRAFVRARSPKYRGAVYLADDAKLVHISPVERLLDCRRRCSRLMIPIAPDWGVTFRKSQGMAFGAGRDAECVGARSPTPSFEK